jgi:predicted metalloenzyme YecM
MSPDVEEDYPTRLDLCTHAITGSQYPSYQPIYICDTCHRRPDGDGGGGGSGSFSSNDNNTTTDAIHCNADDTDSDAGVIHDEGPPPLPCCICQSCAEVCHADHDVSYVGIGPCTCDCSYLQPDTTTTDGNNNNLKQNYCEDNISGEEEEEDAVKICHCNLANHSSKAATKLGFTTQRPLNAPLPLKIPPPPSMVSMESTNNNDMEDEDADNDNALQSSSLIGYSTCIECNSTLGGYVYDSYTIRPSHSIASDTTKFIYMNNNTDGHEEEKSLQSMCDNLISQAIALDACTQGTFWVPSSIDDNTNNNNDDDIDGNNRHIKSNPSKNKLDDGYCDLELFAREVYQHHVQSYMSHLSTSANGTTTVGGAEWWVQVKPAGSSHAPVNLHYDKDETLAESFGLGSFPTLSTVTYLTDAQDNVPTIVFPRTYNDEIELSIESMLISHAVKGKHLVFDGRLLHGAPAHRALLRHRGCNSSREDGNDTNDESVLTTSLRVTLLVNIWLSGKPACVDVLPESIRSKVRCAAITEPTIYGYSMEFAKRHVSHLSVQAGSSSKLNNGNDTAMGDEMIILPFVSNGDAYAGVDDVEVDEERVDDVNEEADDMEVASREEICEAFDVESEEDDEELYLVLSEFPPAECLRDDADTFVVSFGDRNGARIVRGDALDEASDRQQCPWKKFASINKISDEEIGERCITDAALFLSYLHDNVPSFVSSVIDELKMRYEMDLTMHQADHVCYRTESIEQYSTLVKSLRTATDDFTVLTESEIGGRPIATFKLNTPITIKTANGNRIIDIIEVPSPKDGSPYPAGLEHVEFVIGDGSHKSPVNSETHRTVLAEWMSRYPSILWNTKALNKACNPDVTANLNMNMPRYGKVAVKFHLMPLEEVIKFEREVTQVNSARNIRVS